MRVGQKYTREDETKEGMELEAKTGVDESLWQALTDEDGGILRAGLLPKVDCASSSGAKQLLNAVNQALPKITIDIYIYIS